MDYKRKKTYISCLLKKMWMFSNAQPVLRDFHACLFKRKAPLIIYIHLLVLITLCCLSKNTLLTCFPDVFDCVFPTVVTIVGEFWPFWRLLVVWSGQLSSRNSRPHNEAHWSQHELLARADHEVKTRRHKISWGKTSELFNFLALFRLTQVTGEDWECF